MSKCVKCFHSKFAAGFDQPVGCLLHDLTFSQSSPQPDRCPASLELVLKKCLTSILKSKTG